MDGGCRESRAGVQGGDATQLLFEGPYVDVGGFSFDVAPDGRRFLLLEPAEQDAAPVTHLNVVLNWFEEVKQKAAPRPASNGSTND